MELNQEWVSKAQDAFDHSPSNREGIAAAIETYLAVGLFCGAVLGMCVTALVSINKGEKDDGI